MRVLYASLADVMPFLKADLAALYAFESPALYAIFLAFISERSLGVIQGLVFGKTRKLLPGCDRVHTKVNIIKN